MAKKTQSFVKQAAILALAGIIVRVLGFAYRLPLTDMIGDEGNGIYSAGYYLYNFFLVLSSAGLPVAISKMVSERISLGQYKNAKKVLRVSFITSGGAGLVCSVIMFVFAKQFCAVIESPRSYYSILTLSPTVFIVSLMAVLRGYFQGLNTTVPTAFSQFIEQIFNAFFSVYLAWVLVGYGIEFGAAGGTAGTGIGAFAGLIYLIMCYIRQRKSIYSDFKLNDKGNYELEGGMDIAVKLIKTAVPIITGTAIFSMTNLIDMKMVNNRLSASGCFSPEQIDALYGQLTGKYVTITTLPVSISTSLATAVIPSIAANMVKKDYETVNSKIATTLRLTMIISVPAAVGIGVLGKEILQLLYPRYSDGAVLLRIGALSIIFLALSQIATGVLQGIGKVQIPAVSALIGSIIKIPVNYFLISIPQINVAGAVIGTTVCYAAASCINIIALHKATGVKTNLSEILYKPVFSSLVMGAACILSYKAVFWVTHINAVSCLISIFIGMAVYFAVQLALKGFMREDLLLMPMGGKMVSVLEKYGFIK